MLTFRFSSVNLFLVGLTFSLAPIIAKSTAQERTIQRWAIVAAQQVRGKRISDLLTVRLSNMDGVRLVEREEISRVLDELQLSASELVEPESAVQFGKLASADAIVFLQYEERPTLHRVRVIDSRSGVRLLDESIPPTNLQEDVDTLAGRLRQAAEKLRAPANTRRYVGLVGVRSEEPGRGLNGVARALAVLVEHQLSLAPHVVVLEREQLQRLTKERDLTGIELSLKPSTVLLEIGLRRESEHKLAITIKLTPFAAGQTHTIRLVAPADNLAVAGETLVEQVLAEICSTRFDVPPLAPRDEAAAFFERAKWLYSHRDLDDAVGLFETALALDPSHEHQRYTALCYGSLAADRRRATMERLEAAYRHHEIDFDLLREWIADRPSSKRRYFATQVFGCFLQLPTDASPEQRRLMADVNRLRLEKYNTLRSHLWREGDGLAPLLVTRIRFAHDLADSAESFRRDVQVVVEELLQQLAAGRFSDRETRAAFGSVCSAFRDLPNQMVYSPGASGKWSLRDLIPLYQWLADCDDPTIRLCGHYGVATCDDGVDGVEAARTILLAMCDGLPVNWDDSQLVLLLRAVERMREARQLNDFFLAELRKAEADSDATSLVRYPRLFNEFLRSDTSPVVRKWCERVLRLLDEKAFDDKLGAEAESVREAAERVVRARYRKPAKLTGTWAQYELTPIPIMNRRPEHAELVYVHVEDGTGMKKRDAPILLVWRGREVGQASSPSDDDVGGGGRNETRLSAAPVSQPDGPARAMPVAIQQRGALHEYIVTRLPGDGGEMRELGRIALAMPGPRFVVDTGRAVFLADHGLAVIAGGVSEHFDPSDGLPTEQITTMAWLDERLYLGFSGGVTEFDPASKTFHLVATSKAVERRHRLDGGKLCHVKSMLGDSVHNCLWISVDGRTIPERTGIWKYTPTTGEMLRVVEDSSGPLTWSDGTLFYKISAPGQPLGTRFRGSWPFRRLDPATETAMPLEGFEPFTPSVPGARPPGWVFLNGHILSVSGHLLETPRKSSSLSYRGGWQTVQRLGDGALAAAHRDKEARLWRIEPRKGTLEAGPPNHDAQ